MKLFVVGLQQASNKGKRGHCHQVEGAIGGFRYHVEHINVRVQADCTSQSTIIWRLMDESVEGDSGAMLISTRKKSAETAHTGWEMTAFQSSNLLGPFQFRYWKLAGRPTENLMKAYSAFIYKDIILELEHSLDNLLGIPEGVYH
jgi:hypothetical protein